MQEKNNVNYYSIIPASVRYDNELTASEKLFYGEITALSNKHGYCFATNSYFSNLYKVSDRTIIRWINKLEGKGYINKQIIYGDNNECIERRIYLCNKMSPPHDINVTTPTDTDVTTPHDINVTHNNTSINNTSINNINNNPSENWFNEFWTSYPRKVAKPKCEDKFKKLCKDEKTFNEIMEGLNKYNELQFKYTEPQFIPHPLTWLNQERWKDEVIEKKPNQSNQSNKLNLPDYYQKFKGLDKIESEDEKAIEWLKTKFDLSDKELRCFRHTTNEQLKKAVLNAKDKSYRGILDYLEKQETDEEKIAILQGWESVADREKAKKDLEERIKNL
jgi:hypothetical protein